VVGIITVCADGNLVYDLKKRCLETDQACVALIKALKERGLLDSTLVVWGGEFGRTPMMQGDLKPDQLGRDHHPHGYNGVDGWRRHQTRRRLRKPMISGSTRSRIKSMSTTCTPPSLTGSAWTTPS